MAPSSTRPLHGDPRPRGGAPQPRRAQRPEPRPEARPDSKAEPGADPEPELPAADRPLDRIDRRIVLELQRDASLSLARLADRVGLSQTPCWRRVQRLEQTGVLTARVALADPEKLGLRLTAFVSVTAADHGPAWREAFLAVLATSPEVLEVWRIAGEADYLLKVVTPDVAAFDAFYLRLIAAVELRAVVSQFAMERVAYTTALPVAPGPDP